MLKIIKKLLGLTLLISTVGIATYQSMVNISAVPNDQVVPKNLN